MEFNKIVKKMSKLEGSIIDHEDILDLVDPRNSREAEGKRDAYKLTYLLKAHKILFPIRNGLFMVTSPQEIENISEVDIIQNRYWKIARKLILRYAQRDGIIVGSKALEIHLKDESIPDVLIVYTMSTNKLVTISRDCKIQFRTVVSGKKEGRGNLASFLLKHSERMEIDDCSLRVANRELALLDALLIHKGAPEVDSYLIRKFLKRYSKSIDREILGSLVAHKYVTAANRLRALAKELGENELYEKALDTIKREGGGCFLTV